VEVDELESDTESDQGAGASPSQKKAGKRMGERVPGTTLLPISRVENIVQADGITTNLTMSKEAAFVLSIATEEFIKRMVQAGHRQASAFNRNIVNYVDMAVSTRQYQEFMFLQDTIPEPMSLAEALDRRKTKEKNDLETNPAMCSATQTSLPGLASSGSHVNGKLKPRNRSVNGKEKANASASASATLQGEHARQLGPVNAPDDPTMGIIRSSSGRVIRSTRAARGDDADDDESGMTNGFAHPRDHDSWTDSTSPRRPLPTSNHAGGPTPSSFTPPWPGQFTGPASAFMQDSQNTFGRMVQNPGRTIYSQNTRPENGSYS